MTADFGRLYEQLGVDATCSIDEFRHACRRRIGELHPDRGDGAPLRGRRDMPLDELLALYTAAVQFHQKHGRLPGAPATPARTATHTPATPVAAASAVPAARRTPQPAAATSHRWPMVVLLASIGLLASLAWTQTTGVATAPVADADGEAGAEAQIPATATVTQLELGMDPETVLALQGEPLRIDGGQWEYGPSWLRFEKKVLVDWYSSPLHPLRTEAPRPEHVAPSAP